VKHVDNPQVASLDGVARRTLEDKGTGEKKDYYLGTLRADLAKPLTFVPVIEQSKRTYLNERTDNGYQRGASALRMGHFATFLRQNPLSVVPPVVLSGRGAWSFESKTDYGRVHIHDAAAVVDGQHRLGGYVRLYEEGQDARPIDFLLLPDLSVDDEVKEFLSINNSQKGVPKPLTAYLEGSDDAMAAWGLNESATSPFKDRISRQAMVKGQLFNLGSVASNIKRTFAHGAFQDVDLDAKVEILERYWTIIADQFPTEWDDINRARKDMEYKLLELTGFIAWSWAGSDILAPAFDAATHTVNWDAVDMRIKHLADLQCIDWSKTGEFIGRTGEYGGKAIHTKMQQCLQMNASGAATSMD
jgi:DNA sulfur modification protein DndB